MDRTTRDESNNESEHTNSSDSSEEQEARISSDTLLEADIEFVSSEDDLAATSTDSGNSVDHADQVQNIRRTEIFLITRPKKRPKKTWRLCIPTCNGWGLAGLPPKPKAWSSSLRKKIALL
jgi:hypothetical protein